MIETLRKEWQAQVALILLLILSLWWLFNPHVTQERFFGDFASIYVLMALWGGFWGIIIAREWGGFGSVMGKAILMYSCGLLAQVFGQLVYAYYSFYQHIPVPYPSLGDLGFFGSIPLYIYGTLLLAKASGVTVSLQSFEKKLQAIIIPVLMLGIGYFLFLQDYTFEWSSPIKVFLDFGYPFGQAIYVSLAILTYLLTRGVLGGIMKSKILFILFALCIQFMSDYTFLFQSSRGTFVTGGINDFMYLVSYFLMTIALIQFQTVYNNLRRSN